MEIKSEINRLGYGMISEDLREVLFPDSYEEVTLRDKGMIYDHLRSFDLDFPKDQKELKLDFPFDFKSILKGMSPKEYLNKVALKRYSEIAEELEEFSHKDLPKGIPTYYPQTLSMLSPGWNFVQDESFKPVDLPEGRILCFDTETLVRFRSWPVMASACNGSDFYLWIHPSILSEKPFYKELIPLGKNKIIINHFVSYDSIRVEETYEMDDSNIFIDTASMHIAVSGMGNQQRGEYDNPNRKYTKKWMEHTSGNSLIEVYNYHCKPVHPLEEQDKLIRNIFVKKGLPEVVENLYDLTRYALKDSLYPLRIFSKLWNKFRFYNPKDFTLAGQIILNKMKLPVVKDWDKWVNSVNLKYDVTQVEMNQALTELAHELFNKFMENGKEAYLGNPWYETLDWSVAKTGANKGKPAWYRKAILSSYAKKKGKYPVSVSSELAPILLQVSWKDSPVLKDKVKKWCYESTQEDKLSFFSKSLEKWVCKVPHPKGDNNNCGNPLSKDYIKHMDSGTLASKDPRALELMLKAKSLSYWKSMQSRVEGYFTHETDGITWIKPQILAHGTVTRRAVESTWLTASDIKPEVIGSELLSRIQAPKGYVLVGADFDAQEMKIGAAKADSKFKLHGSSAMSLTQMLGDKKKKTDSHSLLNKDLELGSRQLAKTLNFLMLFFGGVKGLFEAIKTARPELSDYQAESLAKKAIKLRRGKKKKNLAGKYKYINGTDSWAYNFMTELAETEYNRTILGQSAISEALQKVNVGKDYMPSRCNRSIQSAGVDILHVFITLIEHFIEMFEVEGILILTRHDETWTMVREGQAELMADIFQLSHALTWCIFYEAYGFNSIPFNYLFFSSINVDYVVRKEVDNCTDEETREYTGTKTVSNTFESIPKGKSLFYEVTLA